MIEKIRGWFSGVDFAHGLGVVFGEVWRWVAKLPRRVFDGCVAFVKTPAVWFSAPAFVLAGYVAGFWLVESRLVDVRGQVKALAAEKGALAVQIAGLTRDNGELESALKKAKEASMPSQAPTPPMAGKSPSAATPAPAKRKPKPVAPATGWWW